MIRRLLRPALGIAISAAAVALVVPAIDVQALGSAMRIFDVRLVPLAIALYFVGVWLRSIRWRYLLPAPPSTHQLFRVSIVGFAVNHLVPVRIGDVARAYLLAHWCEVPFGTTVASLVVERLLDGLTLALLLLAIVRFVPAPGYVVGLGAIATALFGGLALATVVAAFRPDLLNRFAARVARIAPPRIGRWLTRVAHTFAEGRGYQPHHVQHRHGVRADRAQRVVAAGDPGGRRDHVAHAHLAAPVVIRNVSTNSHPTMNGPSRGQTYS